MHDSLPTGLSVGCFCTIWRLPEVAKTNGVEIRGRCVILVAISEPY